MTARLAALVAAIAMVVAAIFIRGRIDRSSTTVRLTCATELAAACNAIGHGTKVTVEPAGATADRLTALDDGADAGLDAWLAPGPWPQIVDQARAAANRTPLFTSSSSLAQTRLTLVVRTGGQFKCAGSQWTCVDDGMAPLGRKADIPDPATEATGSLVLAAMTQGLPADSAEAATVLSSVRGVDTRAGDAATAILLTSPQMDVVASLDAVVRPVIDTAADKSKATLLYPQPVSNVEAVLGVAGNGKAARRAREAVGGAPGAQALRDAGWDASGSAAGGPEPDVIAALRAAWKAQQ